MKKFLLPVALWCLLHMAACGGGGGSGNGSGAEAPSGASRAALERAFSDRGFASPVAIVQHPDDDQRWYVVERAGRVMTFRADSDDAALPFVDIRSQVAAEGEGGLLGMAFHPAFGSNGLVFLSYTGPGNPLTSHIARVTSPDDGLSVDNATQTILLSVDQPFSNHNGGQIAFGPDGFLYAGLGDGGSGGDPQGNGQDTRTLLGAMLRIDVDNPGTGGRLYAIPSDNPFANSADCSDGAGCPEIFAWGFRNPWRWSFDPATGNLWVGDVGQAAWEEIDRVVIGGNYGWNILEGNHCLIEGCDATGLVPPATEYDHGVGQSVTGGYVYRGTRLDLDGDYIYGDFVTGDIFRLIEADQGGMQSRVLIQSGLNIASFGQDRNGEIYVVSLGDGGIYTLVPAN